VGWTIGGYVVTTPEIEEFAKILIEWVRDAAIRSNDRALHGEHVIAKRWRDAAASGSPEAFAKVLIPDVVDDTLFYLLHAIDDGLLKLSFTASNGKIVDLSTEGLSELAGWYAGKEWVAKYTKERFVDDFSDLK
jgi:hypothetical protein